MKRNVILLALLIVAFSFPSIGSVSNADALGNYGCGNKDKRTHVNCLRGLLSSTPHGVAVQQSSPSKDGLGNYGCGNHNRRTHVNCLRGLLDQHGAHLRVGGAPLHQGYAPGTAPQFKPPVSGTGVKGNAAPGSAPEENAPQFNRPKSGTGIIGYTGAEPRYAPGTAPQFTPPVSGTGVKGRVECTPALRSAGDC